MEGAYSGIGGYKAIFRFCLQRDALRRKAWVRLVKERGLLNEALEAATRRAGRNATTVIYFAQADKDNYERWNARP